MIKCEKVKLLSGGNTTKLEKLYNEWYLKQAQERVGHTALSNMPFAVVDRQLVIRNYEGAETFALAIFYVDYVLEQHEQGSMDKAGHVNSASMFSAKK